MRSPCGSDILCLLSSLFDRPAFWILAALLVLWLAVVILGQFHFYSRDAARKDAARIRRQYPPYQVLNGLIAIAVAASLTSVADAPRVLFYVGCLIIAWFVFAGIRWGRYCEGCGTPMDRKRCAACGGKRWQGHHGRAGAVPRPRVDR